MSSESVDRDMITGALVRALKPVDFVHALWEQGAASFGRIDRWSDIDIIVVCDDDAVEKVFTHAEEALTTLADMDLAYKVPQPPPGFAQKFYHLKATAPFLFIDFAVTGLGTPDKFLEQEIHGPPVIHFDKRHVTELPPLDREKFRGTLQAALANVKTRFGIFHVFFDKEYNRGHYVEALDFYYGFALGSLLTVLRMKHAPYHYSFRSKYVYHDLPAEVCRRLETLYFVNDAEDLKRKFEDVKQWFWAAAEELDLGGDK